MPKSDVDYPTSSLFSKPYGHKRIDYPASPIFSKPFSGRAKPSTSPKKPATARVRELEQDVCDLKADSITKDQILTALLAEVRALRAEFDAVKKQQPTRTRSAHPKRPLILGLTEDELGEKF